MQLLRALALVAAASCGTGRTTTDASANVSAVELDAGPQGERFDSGLTPLDGPPAPPADAFRF